MSRFRPIDRDFLLPPVQDGLLEAQVARYVVEVVEGLDLGESAISLVEFIALLVEIHRMIRRRTVVRSGIAIWLPGLGSVLSFNRGSQRELRGKTFFDLPGFLASNVMAPMGSLLSVLFAGLGMEQEASRAELAVRKAGYGLWRKVIRHITPVGVLLSLRRAMGARTEVVHA
jgi:SNF family Na+-dependent transporter